jgi:hypothetical protein
VASSLSVALLVGMAGSAVLSVLTEPVALNPLLSAT